MFLPPVQRSRPARCCSTATTGAESPLPRWRMWNGTNLTEILQSVKKLIILTEELKICQNYGALR